MRQPGTVSCVRRCTSSPRQTLLTSFVVYFACETCGAIWQAERPLHQKASAGNLDRGSSGGSPAADSSLSAVRRGGFAQHLILGSLPASGSADLKSQRT